MSKKIKLFIIFVILLLAAATFQFIDKKPPNVELTLAPSVAKVVVDNSKTIKQGKFYLAPGHHTLSVTMKGFADRKIDFDTTDSKIIKLVSVLVPNSPVGDKWLTDHPDESLRREGLGGQQFDQQASDLSKNMPLVSKLPFIDQFYRVDYGVSQISPNDSTQAAIYITYYSDTGKQQALDWLKFQGYDPAKLEIIYKNGFAQ